MAKPVVIFGTGDFARVASVYLAHDSPHEVAAFTVHREYLTAPTLLAKPVVPFEELADTHPPERFDMLVATGFKGVNRVRAGLYRECKDRGYELIRYVCSTAVVWGGVELGDNVFVFDQVVIQPFARVGSDTIVWGGSYIAHDATVGSHCFLSLHAAVSGRAAVGDHCFLGANSTVRDRVTLGEGTVVGAGAVVLKDTAPGSVLRGADPSPIPGHRLKEI